MNRFAAYKPAMPAKLRRRPKPDQRRALELLADCPGRPHLRRCCSHGFTSSEIERLGTRGRLPLFAFVQAYCE